MYVLTCTACGLCFVAPDDGQVINLPIRVAWKEYIQCCALHCTHTALHISHVCNLHTSASTTIWDMYSSYVLTRYMGRTFPAASHPPRTCTWSWSTCPAATATACCVTLELLMRTLHGSMWLRPCWHWNTATARQVGLLGTCKMGHCAL